MDEKSKRLLGKATVAAASLGFASLPGGAIPQGQVMVPIGDQAVNGSNLMVDPLVELMLRASGSRSAEALKRELREMLSYFTPERMAQMPALVRGLKSLGLSREAEEDIVVTVVELISSSELSMNDEQIEQLAAALAAEPARAFLTPSISPEPSDASDRNAARGVGVYGG